MIIVKNKTFHPSQICRVKSLIKSVIMQADVADYLFAIS